VDRHDSSNPTGTDPGTGPAYLAPTMIRLGTLSDLTLSGAAGFPDGFGGVEGGGGISILP
jgi:hypothetical protein